MAAQRIQGQASACGSWRVFVLIDAARSCCLAEFEPKPPTQRAGSSLYLADARKKRALTNPYVG